MNISRAIADAKNRLHGITDSPGADAEILLAHVLQCNRTWLHTWPEKNLTAEQFQQYTALIEKRCEHQPVAYLTGSRGFWSFDLHVNEATLIPRPETELLVEQALEKIPPDAGMHVLDLGTGSGAIALAIAYERPGCKVTAIEQSAKALQVAQQNATDLGLKNITFLQGNWFEPLQGLKFDLIVSNPPYIAERDPHLTRGDVQHEPLSALAAGNDGLDDIRHIIAEAKKHLNPQSWLLLEHGYDQQQAVQQLFCQCGYPSVQQIKDLGGHARISMGRYR